MTILATMLRGLRSRSLLSVGSIVLTALAVASAVLGPMFASGVTRSYLVARLNEAPPALTSTSWLFTPDPGEATDPETAARLAAVAVTEQYPNPFTVQQSSWETPRFAALNGLAQLLAREGVCEHLVLSAGRCPRAPGEAMWSGVDLDYTHHQVGDVLSLGHGYDDVRIVGSYRAPAAPSHYWPRPNRLGSMPKRVSEKTGIVTPYTPSPLIVPTEAVAAMPADSWVVRVETVLVAPPSFDDADLRRAVAASKALDDKERAVEGGRILVDGPDDLSLISREVSLQQATARSSIAPAMLSLILVALALLSRLLLSASQLRAPELALASLRGTPTLRIWGLGLAEPVLLLAIGLPLGLGLGIGSGIVLAHQWLVPGLPLPIPWLSFAAAGLVAVAALVVAVLAVGTVLRVSLAGQLSGVHRPVATRRLVVLAQLLLVAAAVAVVATKVAGGGSDPDLTDLVLPVLLGVVAGLGAARGVTALAGWWARQRPHSPALPRFVAARALSRRREGTLTVLPITVAIAIGVFSLGVYDAAATWRHSVAATNAPADEVWTSALPMRTTYDLTHQLDPDGRYLMAAGELYATGGRATVLDTPRLERVGVWSEEWTRGLDAAGVADLLAPAGVPPSFTGRTVSLTVDRQVEASAPLWIELTLYPTEATAAVKAYLGPFPQGKFTRTVEVPQCRNGCRWEAMTLAGGAGLPVEMVGRATVSEVAVDGVPLPDALSEPHWATAPDSPEESRPLHLAVDGQALQIDVDSRGGLGQARLMVGDIPDLRPVIVGLDGGDNLTKRDDGGEDFQLTLEAFPVRTVATASSTPFFGPEGMVVDFTMLAAGRRVYDAMFTPYVLARADTPDAMKQALADRGLVVSTTLVAEQHTLDNSAYALALRLYLVVAVLVLLMAFAGLAVSTAVQLPERRRDAAALRVVGVRRSQVVAAAAWEFLIVLGSAAVSGLAAGLLAQDIVLRTVTIGVVETISTPELSTRVDTTMVAAWAAGLALALGAVGVASATLVVRGARGATLRESTR